MITKPKWAEWKYALYIGEGGWGSADTLILVKPKGIVKMVLNACQNKYFQDNEGKMPNAYWETIPGETFDVPGLKVEDIEKRPQHIMGMDGFTVIAYDLSDNSIKRLWEEEDYHQIEPLNMIRERHTLLTKTLVELNKKISIQNMVNDEIKAFGKELNTSEE